VFEPGARNHWHSHPGGQILIVTDGVGYYQEKGKSKQVIRKGDVVKILPDIVHWHGAATDSEITHIAINTNTQNGVVVWLQPVTDDEYDS
jgi:quercetin dioxygenase-like cupin family protein